MTAQDSSPPRGQLLFALMFLGLSVFLVTQLGDEARFSSKGKLVAQPAFWPAIGVFGMALFSLLHALLQFRNLRFSEDLAEGAYWFRALEYLAWFMAYVFLVPVAGYLLSTLVFMLALVIRAGLSDRRLLLAALATGFVIVLVFKTFLGVKIPGAQWYEHLPEGVRNFMIVNF